jgi:hypothetical protein
VEEAESGDRMERAAPAVRISSAYWSVVESPHGSKFAQLHSTCLVGDGIHSSGRRCRGRGVISAQSHAALEAAVINMV